MKAPDYSFEPMDEEDAPEISASHCEFHDVANDSDDLAELLDPERRQGYCAVLSEDELVGFCFEARMPGGSHPDRVDVGLGFRPDLTGGGLGLEFLLAGLEFAWRCYAPVSGSAWRRSTSVRSGSTSPPETGARKSSLRA